MLFKKKEIHNDLPDGTEDIIRICDVIIPKDFRLSNPHHYKLERCRNLYYKLGHLDKPITVIVETNEKGLPSKFILVDGYTRLLFARNYLHRELIPAKYISYEEYDIKQYNKENMNGFQSYRLRTNEI